MMIADLCRCFGLELENEMHKNRGIYLLSSAVIWSAMLWGVVQIKPTLVPAIDIGHVPVITTEPILPEPIPDPPPVKRPEVIKQDPIKIVQNGPPENRPTPPNDGIATPQTGDTNVTGTGPIDVVDGGAGEIVPEASGTVIVVANLCNERALAANPLQPFSVERAYPVRMEERGITGMVQATLDIDETGKPIDVKIVNSTNSGFDSAVIREGMKMKFRPARKDCKFTASTWALNVKFEIMDQ